MRIIIIGLIVILNLLGYTSCKTNQKENHIIYDDPNINLNLEIELEKFLFTNISSKIDTLNYKNSYFIITENPNLEIKYNYIFKNYEEDEEVLKIEEFYQRDLEIIKYKENKKVNSVVLNGNKLLKNILEEYETDSSKINLLKNKLIVKYYVFNSLEEIKIVVDFAFIVSDAVYNSKSIIYDINLKIK